MKKIFVLTGEPSGDKLASTVINKLKQNNSEIEYLSVGGSHLNKLGVKSIYDLKEITYIGFTSVILNLFKIRNKINETVKKIIEFNPDILFSVDSPDFTLRVAEKVKSINPNIKTIHYVAPQVWVWREGRVKNFKKFLDHVLLLFNFEKKYFDKESIKNTFVGHPLLENKENVKTNLSNIINENKKIISLFAGSRTSETNVLLPILINFIELMNKKFNEYNFIFHATDQNKDLIKDEIKKANFDNVDVISEENIKSQILSNSIFAVAKSGTVSLEICNAKVPSIIIYKMGMINFFIVKMLVKVKFANIINIAAKEEIIPELLQSNCNPTNIYNTVDKLLSNKSTLDKQVIKTQEIIRNFKTEKSSEIASSVLINSL